MPNMASADGSHDTLLRLLFDQAPGFVAILEGPDHVFTLINPAYRHLIGDRDVVGKPLVEALPETASQWFLNVLDDIIVTGKPFVGKRTPFDLDRTPGSERETRILDFVYQPVFDNGGAVVAIFVQGQDVTDHVAAEQSALAESSKREEQHRVFTTLLSSIEDFAYTFDPGGRFVYANPPLVELLGLTFEQVVGRRFIDLPYPAELAQLLDAQVDEVVRTRAKVRGQTFYVSPTGAQGWYEYIFSPVLDASGRVQTVTGTTRDITQRVEHESQLAALNEAERAARSLAERASRSKDEFLATLSHELRTPLNTILGWAQLMARGNINAQQVRTTGEKITRSARAQARLISDLLDMNAILSGKLELDRAQVSLALPLYDAIEAVQLDAGRRNVMLQAPASPTLPDLYCDPGRMQQVFWNLLTNAIKFSAPGTRVLVTVTTRGDHLDIVISDNGLGVTAEFLPYLFERFTQADSSSNRRHGGLGLGLSICKSIVEMHGGSIRAQSPGKGAGTAFTVSLPFQDERTKLAAEPLVRFDQGTTVSDEELVMLHGARILLVDDDEEGRDAMSTALRSLGVDVVTAGSASDAFDVLADLTTDLVLCDIGMPVVDGYEFMQLLRCRSRVPAIALTAFARPEDRRDALTAGFAAHIAKPASAVSVAVLCARVLTEADPLPSGTQL
jgi:PAS domain S-box-containing protein